MTAVFRAITLLLAALLALPGPVDAAGGHDRDIYIVSFVEPPLAAYRGGVAGDRGITLKATSPAATGQPLDVDAPQAKAYLAHLESLQHERLQQAERALGRRLPVEHAYSIVNNAVAVVLDRDEAQRIAKLPGVAAVERDYVLELQTDAGPRWIGAEALWNGNAGVATRGEGRIVGIIDSGINASHPSFAARAPLDSYQHTNPRSGFLGLCADGSSTACNAKLIGIYDMTTCPASSQNCTDAEPNNGLDSDGHGSHVAATAAGNPVSVSFNLPSGADTRTLSGVAPRANLISYKACEENCRGSWTLAAINRAVQDRVDVINYSLGSATPVDPWDVNNSQAQAILNAREAGVVFVTSAGNSGPGASTIGSPANVPWALAVANSSHDRATAGRLLDLEGGSGPLPNGDGVLIGATRTGGVGPRALVIPTDHPGCSTGTDLDADQTGASNPWSAGRFNGEIVVCERGTQARVAKSNNVRLAGGGGMILINTEEDGESVVADQHSIPTVHLGYRAGQQLKAWLANGSGHRGRIDGQRMITSASFADQLRSSSSRGPVAHSVLAPAVAAPGSDILAAGSGSGSFQFMSGTSMASPHVAGGVALLRAANPGWTVDDVVSALITSANPSIRIGDTPATVFEQGAGRIDLAAAVRAGLSVRSTRNQFLMANPAAGGDPRALNVPWLIDDACVEQCQLRRRVTDLAGGGSWRAEFVGDAALGVTVSPSTFTLGSGATQELVVTFTPKDATRIGQWHEGAIRLSRTDDASASAITRLPVAVRSSVGDLPASITLQAARDRGFSDIALTDLAPLADLRLTASSLAAPVTTAKDLPVDPSNSDPYADIGTGSFVQWVDVAAGVHRLIAETRSATSPDVDLFVGIDRNGDGKPSESEELCRSTSPDASERCVVDIEESAAVAVWVLVQNWQAGPSGLDAVELDTTLLDMSGDGSLTVTGPSNLRSGEALRLRVGWDVPDLAPGERRLGVLRMATGSSTFAEIDVVLQASDTLTRTPNLLTPQRALRVALQPNQRHDGLFIDVPANASALVIDAADAGDVDLHAIPAPTPAGPQPGTAPATSAAAASSTGSAGTRSLRVEGAALQPGRWYIVPHNRSTAQRTPQITVRLEYAGARPALAGGAYYNPARSGAGAFIYPIGDQWGVIWYTYLQDGTPTWYLGAAPAPTGQNSLWRVDLLRFVWNGVEAVPTRVGEALLGFSEPSAFRFSFSVDGESGSERYERLDGGACPQLNGAPLAATGIWFSPSMPGFGYSVNAAASGESYAAYVYDDRGLARWLIGSVAPFGSGPIEVAQLSGFCPLCSYSAPTAQPVGVLTRRFDTAAAGEIGLLFDLAAPLSGSWDRTLPATRMTDSAGCP